MEQWRQYLNKKGSIIQFAVLAVLSVVITNIFTKILIWNESRIEGKLLNDMVLNLFEPSNFTIFNSLFTLGSIGLSLLFIVQKPATTIHFLFAVICICVLRTISLYFVPLEPPPAIIPLSDPVIDRVFYSGQVLVKDLFFSGHTANILLVGLIVEQKWLKVIMFISCLLVASLLLLQHVHYTIDILAAFPAGYIAYKASQLLADKFIRIQYSA